VIDAPGGGGKIPLLPEYVVKLTDKEVVLRNYAGKIYRYKQPKSDSPKPGKKPIPGLEPVLAG
jgi:lysine 2,3-aminomutase